MGCCSDVIEPIAASCCCTPKDTAARAAQAMRTSGCGCAAVVEDAEHLDKQEAQEFLFLLDGSLSNCPR